MQFAIFAQLYVTYMPVMVVVTDLQDRKRIGWVRVLTRNVVGFLSLWVRL